MALKALSVNFQGRKKTTLDIHFNDDIIMDMGSFVFGKVKEQYSEAVTFGRVRGDYKAIWIRFKTFDAAMDFYKNWKRVIN